MALFEVKKDMNEVVITHTPSLKRLINGYTIITTSRIWKPFGNETTQQVSVTLSTFLTKEETMTAEGREFCDPVYVCERQFSIPAGIITGDTVASLYPWVEYDIVQAALIEKHRKEDEAEQSLHDTNIEDEQKREGDLEKREKNREVEKEKEITAARKYFTEK